MFTLPGYLIAGTVYRSATTWILRGQRVCDQRSVIIKTVSNERPGARTLARLRHEYELLKALQLDGIPDCFDWIDNAVGPALILEDYGGQSLRERLQEGPLPPFWVLEIGIAVAKVLGPLHEAGVIHKDLNPSNLIYKYEGEGEDQRIGIQLIDFGISTRLPRETQEERHPNLLEGTLLYLAPEQTGRVNQAVDYRSDFYALGATLYELLTGRTPFRSTDPMELVHCHLARRPPPLHEIDASIPRPLSEIVLKLLAKAPEDRYQSAYGLSVDLEECRERLRQAGPTGSFEPFPLGQHDVSRRLHVPQRLWGREEELAVLLAAFERAATSRGELVLISGYSGIGKSSLVRELQKPIVERRGYFVAAKFEQYRRDTPYEALGQALGKLVLQLLLEEKDLRARFRTALASALGISGSVLFPLVPELEELLGPQPEPPPLSPADAQRRLSLVLKRFFQLFCEQGHPLVLFLDDMQWIDAASLSLLQHLLVSDGPAGILLIGAYRDHEVSATHPLQVSLELIEKSGSVPVRQLRLRPLALEHVQALVAEAMHRQVADIAALAALLAQKTEGNPFFLAQLLEELYRDGLIRFDAALGSWQWELERIRQARITDNVAELMLGLLGKLQPATQALLQQAASLGARFDLATLALIRKEDPRDTAARIWEALAEGLLVPLDERYLAPAVYVQEKALQSQVSYRFLHDRIQQVAYESLPEAECRGQHLHIGRTLWQRAIALPKGDPDGVEARLFDILGHITRGQGTTYIDAPQERIALAALALSAGRKAKAALAAHSALQLLSLGCDFLPQDRWQAHYALSHALYTERATCAFLAGEYAQAAPILDELFAHGRSPLEKAEVLSQRINMYTHLGKYLESLQDAMVCAQLLGVSLNPQATQEDVVPLLAELRGLVKEKEKERNFSSMLDAPEMTDLEKRVLLPVLSSMIPLSLSINPKFFQCLCAHLGIIALRHGNMPHAAFAYVYVGMLLALYGEHALGYDFGRIACQLAERYDAIDIRGKTLFVFAMNLNFRRSHLRDTVQRLYEAYNVCIQGNEVVFASFCGLVLIQTWLNMGRNLEEVHAESRQWLERTRKLNAVVIVYGVLAVSRHCVKLLGGKDIPCETADSGGPDEQRFEESLRTQQGVSQFLHFHCKALYHYLLGQYEEARRALDEAEQRIESVNMLIELFDHALHRVLILRVLHASASQEEQASMRAQMRKDLAVLEGIAACSAGNFGHKLALAQAELAVSSGELEAGFALYERAIALAKEHGFVQYAGMAAECAARTHRQLGRAIAERAYLVDAYDCYSRWGARAKLEQMASTYGAGTFRRSELLRQPAEVRESVTMTVQAASGLDLSTVLKAAQAISSEIRLEPLLLRMLQILLESAGAERGCLLLRRGDDLVIEAAGSAGRVVVSLLKSLPISSGREVPESIVRYVDRRGQPLVLANAAEDPTYAAEPYIKEHGVKSLLCVPLVYQGRQAGIIYLENSLVEDCFTEERLALLRMLSAQMAISIENARLYETLEERVRDRTAALHKAQARLVELERIATEKQMAGGFAHEMRNAIAGSNLILENMLEGENPDAGMPGQIVQELEQIYVFAQSALGTSAMEQVEPLVLSIVKRAEDLDDMLRVVKRSVARGLSITQQILDYAKTGENLRPPSPVHVNHIVQALAEELRLTCANCQVELKLDLCLGNPRLLAHGEHLQSLLRNLVLNSLDATRDLRRAKDASAWIGVRTHTDAEQLFLEVTDNGIGILPEHLSRIFEPFFTTKPQTGTGLGLPFAKKIASLYEGNISVQSEPGKGTTVTVSFPIFKAGQG